MARFDEIVSKEKHATGESRNSFKRMLFRIWSSNQRSDEIRGQETTISRDDIAKSAEVFPTYVSRKIKVLIDAGLITSGRHGYTIQPALEAFMHMLLNDRPAYFEDVEQIAEANCAQTSIDVDIGTRLS